MTLETVAVKTSSDFINCCFQGRGENQTDEIKNTQIRTLGDDKVDSVFSQMSEFGWKHRF